MKLSAFCGVSVDGFLARKNDTFDFLQSSENEPHGFEEFLSSIDVVVMGRRTFEVVQRLGHLGAYGGKPIVVLTMHSIDISGVTNDKIEKMSMEPAEVVKQLESRGYKNAYVDGGITVQRFLIAGSIDRLIINRVPVLIGSGIPLFGQTPQDIILRHIATRTYMGGLVQSEYEVDKRDETQRM